MTHSGRPWPLVIVVSAAALTVAAGLAAPSAVRGPLALWFFLFCPGIAIVGLLEIADPLAEVMIAVAVSISIGMLLSLAMALTDTWSWVAASVILIAVSLAGATAQARRRSNRQRQ